MDILYLVGPDSGHDNRELRWSLRSVAKFAAPVGRVIVAGYPPEWLSDEVVRFPTPDNQGDYKFVCIQRKLFAALDAGVVTGEFLVACDDHFYSKPFNIDATPFYYRRLCLRRFEDTNDDAGGAGYRQCLHETRELLVRNGYTARDCASHCNFRIRAEDAPAVRALIEKDDGKWKARGIDLGSMFYNVRWPLDLFDWTFRKDFKLTAFDEAAVATGQFSIGDAAFNDPKMMEWFDRELGEPCKYETT